jgi:hypothetical protein
LLHNLRSRLTGKPLSSTPQRGTASTASQHTVRNSHPSMHHHNMPPRNSMQLHPVVALE